MTKTVGGLFVSQSILGQYLPRLENELGTLLFYRSKGRLILTATSRLYVDAAEKAMFTKDNLYQDIQNLDNWGRVTIGVTSWFALRMLMGLIPPFKSRSPDVTIGISETNAPPLTQLTLEENIDRGIMVFNVVGLFSRDQIHVLKREEILFAIPRIHPYCRVNPGRPVTTPEFARYFSEDNILMFKRGSALRCLTDQIIEAAGWIPSTMCETNSTVAARSMVAMGTGVTFIEAPCAINGEHISHYLLKPRLYRLNVFVTRKNWVMNRPESTLCHDALRYLSDQG